jgi:hypothetical protein
MEIFGLPQPLTGQELVTVYQTQNGQIAGCSMPLSELQAWLSQAEFSNLPTTLPPTSGIVWNNAGMISIS